MWLACWPTCLYLRLHWTSNLYSVGIGSGEHALFAELDGLLPLVGPLTLLFLSFALPSPPTVTVTVTVLVVVNMPAELDSFYLVLDLHVKPYPPRHLDLDMLAEVDSRLAEINFPFLVLHDPDGR